MIARKALSLLWVAPLLQYATMIPQAIAADALVSGNSWEVEQAGIALKEKLLGLSTAESQRMSIEDHIKVSIDIFAKGLNVSVDDMTHAAESQGMSIEDLIKFSMDKFSFDKFAQDINVSVGGDKAAGARGGSPSGSRVLSAADDFGNVPKTLQGLDSAINQLDGGLGRDIRADVDRILAEINKNRAAFDQVAGNAGRQLISKAEGVRTRVAQIEQRIAGLAKDMITVSGSIVTSFGEIPVDTALDDESAMKLVTAIRKLIQAIDTYNSVAEKLFEPLRVLAGSVGDITSMSLQLQSDFKRASMAGSEVLNKQKQLLRSEAYGTCGGVCTATCLAAFAALFLQPVICGGCIGGCFGTAAGVIEGQTIPNFQRQYAARSESLRRFAVIFKNLGGRAGAASEQANANRNALRGPRSAIDGNLGLFNVSASNYILAGAFANQVVDSARDVQSAALALNNRFK